MGGGTEVYLRRCGSVSQFLVRQGQHVTLVVAPFGGPCHVTIRPVMVCLVSTLKGPGAFIAIRGFWQKESKFMYLKGEREVKKKNYYLIYEIWKFPTGVCRSAFPFLWTNKAVLVRANTRRLGRVALTTYVAMLGATALLSITATVPTARWGWDGDGDSDPLRSIRERYPPKRRSWKIGECAEKKEGVKSFRISQLSLWPTLAGWGGWVFLEFSWHGWSHNNKKWAETWEITDQHSRKPTWLVGKLIIWRSISILNMKIFPAECHFTRG